MFLHEFGAKSSLGLIIICVQWCGLLLRQRDLICACSSCTFHAIALLFVSCPIRANILTCDLKPLDFASGKNCLTFKFVRFKAPGTLDMHLVFYQGWTVSESFETSQCLCVFPLITAVGSVRSDLSPSPLVATCRRRLRTFFFFWRTHKLCSGK